MTWHQQKTFPSGLNCSIGVDALHQSRQRHPGGGLLRTRHQYHMSHCISPSDRLYAVSSRSVGLLFWTNTLALWPTVTICQNGLIGYTFVSGLRWVTLRKSLLAFLLHWARGAQEGENIWYYLAVRIHAIARIHEISDRVSETKSWER